MEDYPGKHSEDYSGEYLSPNDYNQTTYDEYTNFDIQIILSFILFLSCSQVCSSLCMGFIKNCKNNYNKYKLPISKVRSNDNLLLDECSICLEKYKKNEKIINLNCSHSFHQNCLSKWLNNNNTCPQCRENII